MLKELDLSEDTLKDILGKRKVLTEKTSR